MTERDAILEFPWQLWQYLQWHASPAERARREKLERSYTQLNPVLFGLSQDDVPHLVGGVEVEPQADHLRVRSRLGVTRVDGLAGDQLHALLGALDGARSVRNIVRASSLAPKDAHVALESCLGIAFEVPAAIDRLEQKILGPEICRLPKTPYSIDRSYWSNMGDVRAALAELGGHVADGEAFTRFLRGLHVTAVMGGDLACFYKPASPVSDTDVFPGRLRTAHVVVDIRSHQLAHVVLYGALNGVPVVSLQHRDDDLSWGELVLRESGPLFVAPQPERAHFASLASVLRDLMVAARDRAIPEMLARMARFHARFVRLHPFSCANQSLAMNLVNHYMMATVSQYVPHLDLDFFALALPEREYERVFARACRVHATDAKRPPDYALHMRRSTDMLTITDALQHATSPADAGKILASRPDAAALLFVS